MNNVDTSGWVLEADEFDPDDESMTQEERAEITRALRANVEHEEAYRRGDFPVRVTQLINNEYVTYWAFVDGPASKHYPHVIVRDPAWGTYTGYAPDLTGCVVETDDGAAMLDLLPRAMEAWIDRAMREGHPIPHPTRLSTIRLPERVKVA